MKNMLIYYGYPNSFNSATNAWTNEKVAQDMAKYNIIVLGDGVANSNHGDYSNTCAIVLRIRALNPGARIFGYATTNQDLESFKAEVDEWEAIGAHGIFMDESGYDYGKTRDEFNERIDYVHEQNNADTAFVNAWNPNHVIGTWDDPSYDNDSYNPMRVNSHISEDDLYLLENFTVVNSAYETKTQWLKRGYTAHLLCAHHGVELASVSVIANADGSAQDKFYFAYCGAKMFDCDVFGSSDTSYGSGSAAVTHWTRPDISKLGDEYLPLHICNDSNKYLRYFEKGRIVLDFSSGSESATVDNF